MALGGVMFDSEKMHGAGDVLTAVLERADRLQREGEGAETIHVGPCPCGGTLFLYFPDKEEFLEQQNSIDLTWCLVCPIGQVRCSSDDTQVGEYWMALQKGKKKEGKTVHPGALISRVAWKHYEEFDTEHPETPWVGVLQSDNYGAYTFGGEIKVCAMNSQERINEPAMLALLGELSMDGTGDGAFEIVAPDRKVMIGKDRVVRVTEKVGRNEPCPCGSGKKFKKCCGRRA